MLLYKQAFSLPNFDRTGGFAMASSETETGVPDVAFPLYGTQGGGFARYEGDTLVWHSDIPSFLGDVKPGDPVPRGWDFQPANTLARDKAFDAFNL
jgi:hypothetical protein